jgi:hypothetical protein
MPAFPCHRARRLRPRRRLPAACLLASWLIAVLVAGVGGAAEPPAGDATTVATGLLLEKLEEQKMADVIQWVLDRIEADPQADAALKAEVPFRRALAIVTQSRNEVDAKKRSALFDSALGQIDAFLATKPTGGRAIEAYTQKGNLLIERGRSRLAQAERPGVDPKPLRAEAVTFFDQAIKSLEGTVKPDQKEIPEVTNAEDAVLKEFRAVREQIKVITADDPKPAEGKPGEGKAKKPVRRLPDVAKKLERLEAEEEALQVKLLQTRLMTASAHFEKSKALDQGSKEWTAAVDQSTKQFKELADKYSTMGAGLFARYYEGRNYAVLGKREQAVSTLSQFASIDSKAPLVVMLKAKALGTILECHLADKAFDKLDDAGRKLALTPVEKLPGRKLDDDWLALKYRAAAMLDGHAEKLKGKDKKAQLAAVRDAKKLATEVATANAAFAKEARDLAAKLGKDLPEGEEEKTFASVVADARALVSTMQGKQAEAKKLQAAGKADEATALVTQAAADRDAAAKMFEEALGMAKEGGQDEAAVNVARYMLTFLLYDAKRFREAAEMGSLLAERYPNATGSRQAAMIALASWQQLARQPDGAGGDDPKARLLTLARSVSTIWPTEPEGAEAFGILANVAFESRDAAGIIDAVEAMPAESPKRAGLLQRGGAALYREVQAQGRMEPGVGAPAETVAAWKQKAREFLDAGLAGPPATGPALKVQVAAALARCQIALDDGDPKLAVSLLEKPGFGPWTVVSDPQADPGIREGSFAEAVLTVALRSFIQGESLEKAQQAMDKLEALAGQGDEASARLTAMYFQMGRELQEQLGRIGSGPDAAAKAAPVLAGFEKFLDGLAKRDPKVASQIWVATTYLTLGSQQGTGAVVAKEKARQYLDRAAEVYGALLGRKGDPQIAKFEPSIRLKMASIYEELDRFDEAQKQLEWILSDPKRQNSLETQWQAAALLEAAGRAFADKDAAAAEGKLREAAAGRSGEKVTLWGWGGIANKLSRPAFAGSDEKALKAREQFFQARLNLAACLFARSQLPGKEAAAAKELRQKAEASIATTRKMYPDMGGEASRARFEKLLKDVQKAGGAASPRGFAELDERSAAAPAPVKATN